MALALITPQQRSSDNYSKITGAIFGRAKVGKTSLVKTLDPATTLFINLEAGMKSVMDWRGPHVDIATWDDAVDIACLIGGYDPAAASQQYYSAAHFASVMSRYEKLINPAWFKTYFFDSVTDLTRLAMTWARMQPQAFAPKTGKPDMRGAYGLLGIEVIRLLRHVQHAPGKNVWFVGGLDYYKDDNGRDVYEPQSEGSKSKNELPFIVDQVITMSDFDWIDGFGINHNFGRGAIRALCCKSPNPWGLPAGDRSGRLDLIEEPNLAKLMAKINGGNIA
jgi:hypothetical protein